VIDIVRLRAWDPLMKVMSYPDGDGLRQIMFGGADDDIGLGLQLHWSVKNWNRLYPPKERILEEIIFMQFTGIKDSFGADIYEGDIVESRGSQSFNRGKLAQRAPVERIAPTHWKWGQYGTIHAAFSYDGETFKVVGNIYENPEAADAG
jgi:hypothetical protein